MRFQHGYGRTGLDTGALTPPLLPEEGDEVEGL